MRRALFAAAAVAVAVAVPPAARADQPAEPLITDPAGDATVLTAACSFFGPTSGGECEGTPAHAGSDPSVDIVSGDIVRHGQSLDWSLSVADLSDTPLELYVGQPATSARNDSDGYYSLWGYTDDLLVLVEARREWDGDNPAAGVYVASAADPATGVSALIDVEFDTARDRVTMSTPLKALDQLVAQACPTCAPLGDGTVLRDIRAATRTTTVTLVEGGAVVAGTAGGVQSDDARATSTFTID